MLKFSREEEEKSESNFKLTFRKQKSQEKSSSSSPRSSCLGSSQNPQSPFKL